MSKKAWWSRNDDRMLGEIQKAAKPAVKRYRALVAKRYARTPEEETEMLELGKLVRKLERSYLGILGRNPFKRLIDE